MDSEFRTVKQIIEYLKLHETSLNQDLDGETNDYEISYIEGAIDATNHILAYVEELDKAFYEGV